MACSETWLCSPQASTPHFVSNVLEQLILIVGNTYSAVERQHVKYEKYPVLAAEPGLLYASVELLYLGVLRVK